MPDFDRRKLPLTELASLQTEADSSLIIWQVNNYQTVEAVPNGHGLSPLQLLTRLTMGFTDDHRYYKSLGFKEGDIFSKWRFSETNGWKILTVTRTNDRRRAMANSVDFLLSRKRPQPNTVRNLRDPQDYILEVPCTINTKGELAGQVATAKLSALAAINTGHNICNTAQKLSNLVATGYESDYSAG